MSSISNPPPSPKRIFAVCGIVATSFFVACGAVVGFFYYEISQGNTPKEHRDFCGCLKDGELWFSVSKPVGNPLNPDWIWIIKRMNLTSGIITDDGLPKFDFCPFTVLWIGDAIFVVGSQFHQVVDRKLQDLPPLPGVCETIPFEYNGTLTAVLGGTTHGQNQLVHWVDGRWEFGRKILLLVGERHWQHDAQTGRTNLLPLTSEQPTSAPRGAGQFQLTVLPLEQSFHLVMENRSGFSAYRLGFEFIDESIDSASALAPENSIHEVSGWEPLSATDPGPYWLNTHEIVHDQQGLLIAWTDGDLHILRRTLNRQSKELTFEKPSEWRDRDRRSLYFDPLKSHAYIVGWSHTWSSAIVCSIEGDFVRSAHAVIPGFECDYVKRWLRIIGELLTVFVLHAIVLFAGTAWIGRRTARSQFHSGQRQVTLAPQTRRVIAGLVDAAGLYAAIWIAFALIQFRSENIPTTLQDQANILLDLEQYLRWGYVSFEQAFHEMIPLVLSWIFPGICPNPDFLSVVIATMIVFFAVKVKLEGCFGVTPGKWLMGIRTVGSTLRPCGSARALVRNVLYAVDFPLLLTPISAAISVMLSEQGQRIGDRVADTIVIRANSIRDFIPQ